MPLTESNRTGRLLLLLYMKFNPLFAANVHAQLVPPASSKPAVYLIKACCLADLLMKPAFCSVRLLKSSRCRRFPLLLNLPAAAPTAAAAQAWVPGPLALPAVASPLQEQLLALQQQQQPLAAGLQPAAVLHGTRCPPGRCVRRACCSR